MKRSIVILGVILFIAGMIGTCCAAGLGPVEPLGSMKSAIGVEYNTILDRDLEKSGAMTGGEVEESNQVYLDLAIGINDWANIYAKLGTGNFEEKIKWDDGVNHTIKYDYGFLWGIGGNGLYDLGNNFGLGGDVQFDMWWTEVDSITGTGPGTTVFTDRGTLKNYEFQTAAYLTYNYNLANIKIVPYAGGYYSFFKSTIDKTIKFQDNNTVYTHGDSEGDDKFGLLVGANVPAFKNISLNVEGRFIAETAVTAGLSYQF